MGGVTENSKVSLKVFLTVIGIAIAMVSAIGGTLIGRVWAGAAIAANAERIERNDSRLDTVERTLAAMLERSEASERLTLAKLTAIEKLTDERFDGIEKQLNKIEARFPRTP